MMSLGVIAQLILHLIGIGFIWMAILLLVALTGTILLIGFMVICANKLIGKQEF